MDQVLTELTLKTTGVKEHLDLYIDYFGTKIHDCCNSIQVMSMNNGHDSCDCLCKVAKYNNRWEIEPYGLIVEADYCNWGCDECN